MLLRGHVGKRARGVVANPAEAHHRRLEDGQTGDQRGGDALGLWRPARGGLAVGAAFWIGGLLVPVATGRLELAARFAAQWPVLVVGLGAGLAGSLLDSLLGATVQFSGYCSERERMVSGRDPR